MMLHQGYGPINEDTLTVHLLYQAADEASFIRAHFSKLLDVIGQNAAYVQVGVRQSVTTQYVPAIGTRRGVQRTLWCLRHATSESDPGQTYAQMMAERRTLRSDRRH